MKILKSLFCILFCFLGIMLCYYFDKENRQQFNQAKAVKEQELKKEQEKSNTALKIDNGQDEAKKVQTPDENNGTMTVENKMEENTYSTKQSLTGQTRSNNALKIPIITGTNGDLGAGGAENIYEYPIESSEVTAFLQYNCCVLLNKENVTEGWNSVWVDSSSIGYVKTTGSVVDTLYIGTQDSIRDTIVRDAYSYLGTPFEQYGTSLTEGIDCSNYVAKVYEQNGIDIPNIPNEMKNTGTQVSDNQAQPGDVIYYDCNGGNGHVGIFLGEDENGEKYIINTAGHSGVTYPEGGCRINRIQYNDRTIYQFYSFLD